MTRRRAGRFVVVGRHRPSPFPLLTQLIVACVRRPPPDPFVPLVGRSARAVDQQVGVRGGGVLGEVPVLGSAPALKVRPERNSPSRAQRAGQPQVAIGARDEDGEAELRADHARARS